MDLNCKLKSPLQGLPAEQAGDLGEVLINNHTSPNGYIRTFIN